MFKKINTRILFSTLIITLITFSSCEKWVNDTELPSNTIDESQLNNMAMFGRMDKDSYVYGPVIAGVWRAGAIAASDLLVASGAIVDEIVPTAVPNSQFYKELNENKLNADNTSLYSVWSNIQNYRARAEDAINVANTLKPTNSNESKVKEFALINAKLHAGYAYMLLADYFSVSPSNNAVYINRKLASHNEVYAKAQYYWEEALITANPQDSRLLHSLLTKLGIHTANYKLALQHINQSFTKAENFSFLNTIGTASNAFFTALNINVRDAAVDPTFVASLASTASKTRNQIVKAAKGHWSLSTFKERDPLTVSDYDEMQLIRAELIVRNLLAGDALTEVNTVISKYDPTGNSNYSQTLPLTISDILKIRRIFLSLRGTRLIDLRRFNDNGDLNPGFMQRKYHWISIPEIETR